MRLLLDTHVLLWALLDDARLGPTARERLVDGRNQVLVSAVSPWEIELKRSLGKLRAPHDLLEQIERARFDALPIRLDHARAVGDLPDLHRDPFDRMLVAQAIVDRLTILTHDDEIARYDAPVMLV